MGIRVGTFNLNNLFSRFNFAGGITETPTVSNGGITLTFSPDEVKVRTFMGRLVKEKNPADTMTIARRITDVVNADILAVQEVEHIEILKMFNRDFLNNAYREVILVEGNDSRLIDVGILSKLPVGAVTSHQAARHPDRPERRVFGRDLLQIKILKPNGDKLFNIYNTHMKSHFVPHGEDPVEGAAKANARRKQQAEMTGLILEKSERPNGKYILIGDMNDPAESGFLAPMLEIDGQKLVNGLANAVETRPAKPETPGQGPGPATTNWTHRFNPAGPAPPRYEQFDQIWLSPSLSAKLAGAFIDRRTKHSGNGSDHDPAWVELDL
jgi:endonuclease/exonuclease/phosphatase family metal-dependent hydrolase